MHESSARQCPGVSSFAPKMAGAKVGTIPARSSLSVQEERQRSPERVPVDDNDRFPRCLGRRSGIGRGTPHAPTANPSHHHSMLYTLALILIIAWLLGLVSSYTIGGFIHVLLVVAIIVVLIRVIQGRRIE